MADKADLDLVERLTDDYLALETQAKQGTDQVLVEGLSKRRESLGVLKQLLVSGESPEQAKRIAEVFLEDMRIFKESPAVEKQTRLLFKRREFGLEMLIRRLA